MKRLIQLAILAGAAAFVVRRLGVSVALGTVILDDLALTDRVSDPMNLTVVGIGTIPPGTSPELAASAIRRLRVLGLLRADKDVLKALSGRIAFTGAIDSGS